MNDLTKRQYIINKARIKYILSGHTKNITDALRLYLADATVDEQIPLMITTPEIHQVRTILKEIRPRCDECDNELYLKTEARDPGGKLYPTAWVCKKCGIENYSDKTPAMWLNILQDEAREQNLQ